MRRYSVTFFLALSTLFFVSTLSAQQTTTTASTLPFVAIAPGTHPVRIAAPGSWTQAQVNASIVNGVAYIDSKQNADGSFGNTKRRSNSRNRNGFGRVQRARQWGLQQPKRDISGACQDGHQLAAESAERGRRVVGRRPAVARPTGRVSRSAVWAGSRAVDPGVPAAIAKGRTFLINEFQGPVYTGCSSDDSSTTAYYCGGWNYDEDKGRSDESNTGFAMFGLQYTGGIPLGPAPTGISVDNINWQRHIQEILGPPGIGNPFATRNDGGGSYQPGINSGDFSSNANDTGTMLFSLAYDQVPATDPHVVAGLLFGQDVLDVYELEQPTDNMVYHGARWRTAAA